MPAKKKRPISRQRASTEARSGIAEVTGRLDALVSTLKNIGFLILIVGGMFTGFWSFVGKPWAQDFVAVTVQDEVGTRIVELEKALADIQVALAAGTADAVAAKAQIEALSAQIKILQSVLEDGQNKQEQILEILRGQMTTPGE